MDTLSQTELDSLYNRIEKTVNVDSQTEIFDFLRTKPTFDGRTKDGKTKFKNRIIPTTPNWNWRGQQNLAKGIAGESDRVNQISRLRSKKSLVRLRTEMALTRNKELVDEKLRELEDDRTTEYRKLSKDIFSMTESEVNRLSVDEEFFGTALSKSLERAKSQRLKELEEEESGREEEV